MTFISFSLAFITAALGSYYIRKKDYAFAALFYFLALTNLAGAYL